MPTVNTIFVVGLSAHTMLFIGVDSSLVNQTACKSYINNLCKRHHLYNINQTFKINGFFSWAQTQTHTIPKYIISVIRSDGRAPLSWHSDWLSIYDICWEAFGKKNVFGELSSVAYGWCSLLYFLPWDRDRGIAIGYGIWGKGTKYVG